MNKPTKKYIQPEFGLDIPIFAKIYDFYKELSETITFFPKHKKYTLGQRLDDTTLEIIKLLSSIPQSNDRISALKKINIELDLLKVLLRLAKDTRALPEKKYLCLSSSLHEAGKMTGGWIRYLKGF